MRWLTKSARAAVKLFVILICVVNFFGIYKAAIFVQEYDIDFSMVDQSKTNLLATTIFIEDAQDNIDFLINSSESVVGSLDNVDDELIKLSQSSMEISYIMSAFDADAGNFFTQQSDTFRDVSHMIDDTRSTLTKANSYLADFKTTGEQFIGVAKAQIKSIPDSTQLYQRLSDLKQIVYFILIYLSILNLGFLALALIA